MRKLRFAVVAAVLGGVLSGPAIWAQEGAQSAAAPVRHIEYAPEFTAEQILNGNLPRPASPPPLPVTFDAAGFAKDRVFHVPPVGVHPRILFGPQDLPGIKQRLAKTQSGRQMLAYTREQLAKGIDKPGTWENQLYLDLQRGDLVAFGKLYKPTEVSPVAGNSVGVPAELPATKWHHRDPFGMALELKAFVCLLDDDQTQGAALGKAIAAYALYFKPRIEKAAAGPFGDNWWRSMRSAVDGWPFLPFAYDLDYNFMTPEQQKTTRGVLSLLTKGRYTLGMELPPHWRIWNFLGFRRMRRCSRWRLRARRGTIRGSTSGRWSWCGIIWRTRSMRAGWRMSRWGITRAGCRTRPSR